MKNRFYLNSFCLSLFIILSLFAVASFASNFNDEFVMQPMTDSDFVKNDKEGSVESTEILYAIYHETYRDNNIAGLSASFFGPVFASNFQLYIGLGAKLETIKSQPPDRSLKNIPAVDINIGGKYGRTLFVYSEFGFDLGELIGVLILNELNDDDTDDNSTIEKEDTENQVDVDVYLAVGTGVLLAKKFSLSVYAKLQKISGYEVLDHSEVYYGLRLGFLY